MLIRDLQPELIPQCSHGPASGHIQRLFTAQLHEDADLIFHLVLAPSHPAKGTRSRSGWYLSRTTGGPPPCYAAAMQTSRQTK